MKKIFMLAAYAAVALAASAQTQLWDNTKASLHSTYFAPGWNQDAGAGCTASYTDGTVNVHIDVQMQGQWNAQVKLNTGITYTAGKQYDFTCTFTSSKAQGGVTVKLDDAAGIVYDTSVSLPAATEYTYTAVNQDYNGGQNGILVLDFGYCPEGTDITITNFSVVEHDPVADTSAPTVAAPVPTVPADKVFSIYSDSYTSATPNWYMGGWGQSTVDKGDVAIEGNNARHYTNANYLGWELNGTYDLSAYNYVHMDVYAVEGNRIGFTPIWGGEALHMIDLKEKEWTSIDLPLSTWAGINAANIYQLKWAEMPKELYLDNVYFYSKNEEEVTPDPQPGTEPEEGGLVLTNGDNSVTVYAYHYTGTDNYEIVIKSDKAMSGLGGSYCHQNGVGGYYMNGDHCVVSPDGKTITIAITSTVAPTMYTPLFVMMPGEVNFGEIAEFNWIEKAGGEVNPGGGEEGGGEVTPDPGTDPVEGGQLLTSGDHNVTLIGYHYTGTNNYELTITSAEEMNGLGGSFWNINGVGTDMRNSMTVSDDRKKLTFAVESTSAPQIYTPLYIMMPGEVNFGSVVIEWKEKEGGEVNPGGGEEGGGEVTPDPGTGEGTGAVYNAIATGSISTVTYAITWNTDCTLTLDLVKLGGELTQKDGLQKQVTIGKDEWLSLNSGSTTTANKYAAGESVHGFFYFPYAGGAERVDFDYVVGSAQELETGDGGSATVSGVYAGVKSAEDYELGYAVTYNDDKTLTIEVTSFTGAMAEKEGLVKQVNVGDKYIDMVNDKVTTTDTFEPGATLNSFFYFPYAGGALRIDFSYTVATENVVAKVEVAPAVGYSSVYYTEELRVPAGSTAYTAILDGNQLKLQSIASGIIPAGTAAIIDGRGGYLTISETGAASIAGNVLEGVLEATPVADKTLAGKTLCVLGLSEGDDVPGFYQYTGTTLAAHKAYLNVDSSVAASGLRIVVSDGTVTGLGSATSSHLDATSTIVYDLQGRKLAAPVKGVNIVGGRRIVY